MDEEFYLQDVVRCNVCDSPDPKCRCEKCIVRLCVSCAGKHLKDDLTEHTITTRKRDTPTNYPNCQKHSSKQCKLHCEICDIHTCIDCMSSNDHLGHKQCDIIDLFNRKIELIQRDLDDIEYNYGNKNETRSTNIELLKDLLNENSDKLTNALDNLGTKWHKTIDFIITELKEKITDINKKHWLNLEKKEEEIICSNSESLEMKDLLKGLLNTYNVTLVCNYKSTQEKKADFRRLSSKLNLSRPEFYPHEIDMRAISEMFGRLCEQPIIIHENTYAIISTGLDSNSSREIPVYISQPATKKVTTL